MSLRIKAQPPTAHWSKDFVEHLRTVHLTLIATSAALIIVALTMKPYNAALAKNELNKIRELRENWSIQEIFNINSKVKRQTDEWLRSTNSELRKIGYHAKSVDVDNPFCCGGYFEADRAHKKEVRVHVSKEPLVEVDYRDGSKYHRSDYPKQLPDTLSGFRTWWDGLSEQRIHLLIPISIKDVGFPAGGHHHNDEKFQFENDELLYFLRVTRNEDIPYSKSEIEATPYSGGLTDGSFWLLANSKNSKDSFTISILVDQYRDAELSIPNVAAFLKVPSADFDHAFDDLRRIASINGIDNFDRLTEVLSKSDVSDTPVFEAFGIKFPADLATIGGTTALLSVQFYFFLYLRKLYGGLKQDDPGWDVPWIGMDSSGLARVIFLTTVLVLPVTSLFALCGETTARLTKGYRQIDSIHLLSPMWMWHWTVLLKLGALLISIVLSAVIGVLCWKYRPQVTENARELEPKEDLLDNPGDENPKQGTMEIEEVDQN